MILFARRAPAPDADRRLGVVAQMRGEGAGDEVGECAQPRRDEMCLRIDQIEVLLLRLPVRQHGSEPSGAKMRMRKQVEDLHEASALRRGAEQRVAAVEGKVA